MIEKHSRPKLCYILLKYSDQTDRHYFHLYSFIDKLAEHCDIRLIIAQSQGVHRFSQVNTIKALESDQKKRWWLFREIIAAYRAGYRLFYCHYTFGPAVFASLLTRLFGGTTYFWHCIMLDVLLTEHNVSLKSAGYFIFRVGSRIIQTFVTGSEFMKQYYHRQFGVPLSRIEVIPNYLELDRFKVAPGEREHSRGKRGIAEDKLVVLFVHALEKGKGGSQLVPIARMVTEKVPNVLFVVVGDGSERPHIEHDIQRFGLAPFFRLAGSIPNVEVADFYKAADIFIMPSLYEEFSRTLLEAMASAVPFVATDGRGGTYAYTTAMQHDFIVPSGHSDLFAEKVINLLLNEDLRKRLADEGLKHVQLFSQENVLHMFIDRLIKDAGP